MEVYIICTYTQTHKLWKHKYYLYTIIYKYQHNVELIIWDIYIRYTFVIFNLYVCICNQINVDIVYQTYVYLYIYI